MSARHCSQVDWFSIFAIPQLTIALVVSKAVLDSDNDPESMSIMRHAATAAREKHTINS